MRRKEILDACLETPGSRRWSGEVISEGAALRCSGLLRVAIIFGENGDDDVLVVRNAPPPFAASKVANAKTSFVVHASNECFIKSHGGFWRARLVKEINARGMAERKRYETATGVY